MPDLKIDNLNEIYFNSYHKDFSLPVRIATYSRISLENERLLHSIQMQEEMLESSILNCPGTEFVGAYAEKGVSGTTLQREELTKLLWKCENGSVDLILCKSISRLSRNIRNTLNILEQLHRNQVEIYFLKEGLNANTEIGWLTLHLTMLLAEKESRSISENVRWRIRKKFENGIPSGGPVYGLVFDKTKQLYLPSEDEALVVARIFREYDAGKSPSQIAQQLNQEGITGRKGYPFTAPRIYAILQNEKYAGRLRLQKTYTEDVLTHKRVINTGEVKSYFYVDTHPAIVSPELFDRVQARLAANRQSNTNSESSHIRSPFYRKLVCGSCGTFYKRSEIRTKSGRLVFWSCPYRNQKNHSACRQSKISEPDLQCNCIVAMGLPSFDADKFSSTIQKVVIESGRVLTFCFWNGRYRVIANGGIRRKKA